MAFKARRRKYGNTHISGNARVQLGDRQVTRNIRIEKAYIQLQTTFESSDIETLPQALRIGSVQNNPASGTIQPQIQGANLGSASLSLLRGVEVKAEELASNNACERDFRGENTAIVPDTGRGCSIVTSSAGRVDQCGQPQKSRDIALSSSVDAIRPKGMSSEYSCEGQGVALKFPKWLSTVFPWPSLTNILPLLTCQSTRLIGTADVHRCEHDGDAINSDVHTFSTNDVSMLWTGIISYIVGQNLSVKDISDLLIVCQERQLLGLLTCAIWIGFYKYFMTRRLKIALSCSNKVFLEDAYGRSRSFSPYTCADFDILTRFLEVHYRDTTGTTAGALVIAGQFYLMLGSRRGKTFTRRNWRDLVIKPSYKLVNSVYIRRDNAECPSCQVKMTITPLGEFHCPSCGVYHRDCETIDPSVKKATTPSRTDVNTTGTGFLPQSGIWSKPISTSTNVTGTGDAQGILPEVEYDTLGLVNLDLKLQPQQKERTTFFNSARVLYTLSDSDESHLQVVQGRIVVVLLENDMNYHRTNQWHLCEDEFGIQGYVPRIYLDVLEESAIRPSTAEWTQTITRHTECARTSFGIVPPPSAIPPNPPLETVKPAAEVGDWSIIRDKPVTRSKLYIMDAEGDGNDSSSEHGTVYGRSTFTKPDSRCHTSNAHNVRRGVASNSRIFEWIYDQHRLNNDDKPNTLRMRSIDESIHLSDLLYDEQSSTKRWNDLSSAELYYICNDVVYGTMICCELDEECEHGQWFHLECIDLLEMPTRTIRWYCPKGRKKLRKGEYSNGLVARGID